MNYLKYELDKYGAISKTLKTFKSLYEMDDFLSNFHDSNDVREYFFDEINEFLKTKEATEYLNVSSKDGRERNGYVTCYQEYKYHRVGKIMALYDNKIIKDNLYETFIESLKDDKVLKNIYKRKFFLIPTEYLKDELRRIVFNKGGKTPFIRGFVSYIKNLDEENRYIYFRSLCDICNLLQNKKTKSKVSIKIVNVSNIKGINEYQLVKENNFEEISSDEFKYNLRDDAPEYFEDLFYKAIRDNDFEKLFNEFTSEEIDLYSNYYEKGKVK